LEVEPRPVRQGNGSGGESTEKFDDRHGTGGPLHAFEKAMDRDFHRQTKRRERDRDLYLGLWQSPSASYSTTWVMVGLPQTNAA
jgi:hypothetical protein